MRAGDPGRVPTSSTPCPHFPHTVSPVPAHHQDPPGLVGTRGPFGSL